MSAARHGHHLGMNEFGNPSSMISDFLDAGDFAGPDQSVMDVLSASSYLDAQQHDPIPQQIAKQYYGGFITDSDSHHELNRPTKKPKRSVDGTNHASNHQESTENRTASSKKQRGRPRVDPQDETAADRRRTQIRLAQRAYRNRKETTISFLKERVSQLENVIEQMDRSYTQLYDNLHEAGLGSNTNTSPNILSLLTSTMEEFKQLTKTATVEGSEGSEDEVFGRLKIDDRRTSVSEKSSNSGKQLEPAYAGFQVSSNAGQMPSTVRRDTSGILPKVMPSQIAQLESSLVNAVEHGRSLEPTDLSQPANGLYTYSFQETTFARRLHRQCLERAFRYLSNPNIQPEIISRAFRFSFTFSNRNRMLGRFQNLLRRKAGESLENWNIPYFIIGGAGTHFPRRDENGDAVLPPNLMSPARAFGPYQLPSAETPRHEKTVDQLLEAIGFGGEWFDSHDVQEYLKTLGIVLEAQSSFVSVDASQLKGLDELTAQSGGSPSVNSVASQIEPRLRLEAQNSGLGFTFGQSNVVNKLANQAYVWNQQDDGPFFYADDQNQGRSSPKMRMLTLDVERFLTLLVDKSVCLGRAPGYRKADVDASLVASLHEGF